MKHLIVPTAMLMLLSCKKEITQPVPLSATASTATVSNAPSLHLVTNYHHEDVYPYLAYNPCTHENVFIRIDLKESLSERQKGDTIYYNYEVHNEGTKGIGLRSGIKYTGTGHATDAFKAILKNGRYIILKDEIVTNKTVFAAPGGGNNLTSTAKYHISMNDQGQPYFDKIYFAWDYCH